MTEIRERWENHKPVARVAFFTPQGPEEDEVYDVTATGGGNFLSMALSRSSRLVRVVVPTSHLIFLVDVTPRVASGPPADARVFLAGGKSFDLELGSLSRCSSVEDTWQSMVYENGRVRAVICHHAIQEILPLSDDGEQVKLLTINDEFGPELWPELRHKR